MSFTFSAVSESRLIGVHPALVAVVRRALEISTQDFMVLEGVRTPERQAQLYAQGRTAPGPIVTWVQVSNHEPKADGLGWAVDLGPVLAGRVLWNDDEALKAVYDAMMGAASQLAATIRSGWDWNRNGVLGEHGETDKDHYELLAPPQVA